MNIIECLECNPIIAALPNTDLVDEAVISPARVVFLLSGNILQMEHIVTTLKNNEKKVFVHIDLIDGLGRDSAAVDFIAQKVRPHGIISTRSNLLKYAKEIGLATVQRLFLLDSLSFESGINMIKNYHPDFIEAMPGIIPRAIEELCRRVNQPVIAGGMITLKNDVIQAIKAGAVAVSTSKKELWRLL